MKALLMYPERDFDLERPLPPQAAGVRQDLELDVVVRAMADGDEQIASVASNALLDSFDTDVEAVRYRQAIVADTLSHPEPVREMYAIVTAALEEKRKGYWGFLGKKHPALVLRGSLETLRMFMQHLRKLRDIAQAQSGWFESQGFRNLFALLQREFDDPYLTRVEAQLKELDFRGGILMRAELGTGAESEAYTLLRPLEPNPNWLKRLLDHAPSAYTVRIAERDQVGSRTLDAMRNRGVTAAADTLANATDHINGFFEMLRTELAFHVGCANLRERLDARQVPTCFPEPRPADAEPGFRTQSLRDVSLVLSTDREVIANDIDASQRRLVVVTGANQGGKSTFLRSLGLAQLMLQSGMFVAAEAFSAPLCTGLFTHYKREEDATMQQGKLDEELARLGEIADTIRPAACLLSNESFASTNEREGSELARQMTEAMLERGIHVVCVTHLYTFARGLYEQQRGDALFLRAERRADGSRSLRLIEGAPRETSYGEDLYREIFGADETPADVGPRTGTDSAEPIAARARRH